jgi:hypothetical protein
LILPIGPANALLPADPVHGMVLVTCGAVMAMMQQKHGTPQASDISTLTHQNKTVGFDQRPRPYMAVSPEPERTLFFVGVGKWPLPLRVYVCIMHNIILS